MLLLRNFSTQALRVKTNIPKRTQFLPKTLRESIDQYFAKGQVKEIDISGWVRSVRDGKDCLFLTIYDGSMSSGKDLQVVVDKSLMMQSSKPKPTNGSSIKVTGRFTQHPSVASMVEFVANESPTILGPSIAAEYPIPKARVPISTLRNIHLFRTRTRHFAEIARIRCNIMECIQTTLINHYDFILCNTPIITKHDCEGGGESFTLECPKKDFFEDSSSHLTVSGQLHLEIASSAFARVFTHGPCFRAEKSNSGRHLSEFWMLEAEIAFLHSIDPLIDFVSEFVARICKDTFTNFQSEMHQMWNHSKGTASTWQWSFEDLKQWIESDCPIERISYDEAVTDILKKDIECDLSREDEMTLVSHFKGPVIVTNWPASIKPFYMLTTDRDKRDRVACFDLIFPNVGELIGGSLREHDYGELKRAMQSRNMTLDTMQWYLDLRRFGSVPHGGFGLGTDRLVQFLTGSTSIQDVSFIPRAYKQCPF